MKIKNIALLFSASLFVLSACRGAKAPELRVGVSIPTQREERWVRDVQKLEAEAKTAKIDLKVQISDNDSTKQISQCENLFAQGIDVLIIAPHDAAAASVIVEKAHGYGIKVISYDRLIVNADVDLYISFDNVKVGELQGAYLAKAAPRGRYVLLSGAPTDNNAALFKKGAMNILKPLIDSGAIKVVMEQAVKDWQPIEAMKLMENALTANKNKIDAVLAPNDGTAGGCIQAMAVQNLAGKIPVTGQDAELSAVRRIIDGSQSMTVFKDTRELASAAIAAAVKLHAKADPGVNSKVNNGKIDVPSILLVPISVDKANLDKTLIESGYIKKEELSSAK